MDEISLNKNYLLQVTNELYRITLLFPKKEPLRYKMRQLSNEVLANFVDLYQKKDFQEGVKIIEDSNHKIEILDGFFDVARAQNWVRPSDILDLQKEYNAIKEGFLNISSDNKNKEEPQVVVHTSVIEKPRKKEEKQKKTILSSRQEKILRILEDKEKAQVNEVKDYFPDTSKRTLRRDLKELLDNDLIRRKGERNTTFYEIKDV